MRLIRCETRNLSVVQVGNVEVYFSYETPVAVVKTSVGDNECYITEKRFSNTSSRHVNEVRQCHPEHSFLTQDQLLAKIRELTGGAGRDS